MSKSKVKKSPKVNKAEAIDWVEPYPPADPKVLVRVQVTQDLSINGKKYPVGIHFMDADTAHSHGSVLTAPPPIVEE